MNTRPSLAIFLAILLLPQLAVSLPAALIRVPDDAPTIQDAINIASAGDIVEVADGTWTGDGNRDINFSGKAITVRSANGPEACIIDCEGQTYSDEHRGFIFGNGEGRDSVVEGFTIINAGATSSGTAVLIEDASPTITGNVLGDNNYFALLAFGAGSPLITGNTIVDNNNGPTFFDGNTAQLVGNEIIGNSYRGIACTESDILIDGNIIAGNAHTGNHGTGIACTDCSPTIVNNVIRDNYCSGRGAGIYVEEGSPQIINNLIEDNISDNDGAGITFYAECHPELINNTIVGNRSGPNDFGGGIYFIHDWSSAVIRNCIIRGNSPGSIFTHGEESELDISWSNIEDGWPGTGNIDADPLFCVGPWGGRYLSQTAAGQAVTSPCVDAGDPSDAAPDGTTRTDSAPDGGIVDMGFHHEIWAGGENYPETRIVDSPEGYIQLPVVNFVVSGEDYNEPPTPLVYSYRLDGGDWSPYSAQTTITLRDYDLRWHRFEVRAKNAQGQVDPSPARRMFAYSEWDEGYHWSNVVTGPGPGPLNPTLVRTRYAEWEAYGVARHGVNVACGNLDGAGLDEVITGAGPGEAFGPHVRGWTPEGIPVPGVSFLAYGTHKYGVNVAAGDVDGDGFDEIITGAGPGAVFGPHVRGWNVDGGAATSIPGISYFAYGTLKWGVNVSCGDLDGDGRDEIVTGAGPGAVFGPHVRGWRYQGGATASMPGVSFLAYGTPKWGVNVACGDIDNDGLDEIITGPGPSPAFPPHIRAWNYNGTVTPMGHVDFIVYDYLRYGAVVCAADVDNDGIEELVMGTGPDPNEEWIHVKAWNADNGNLWGADSFDPYEVPITHGVRIAGGNIISTDRAVK
jgi:hypothetical protein